MNHELIHNTVLYGGAILTGSFFALLPLLLNNLKTGGH